MKTGNKIDSRNHISGFKEEINKVKNESKDAFFTWFNNSSDTDMAFVRGAWDFTYHIALPISGLIQNPEQKCILEIGHGGGRILAAASNHFGKAVGIDIHENNDVVLKELNDRGICNVELIQIDGKNIQLSDNCMDVVYSFIVLQHVEKIDIFKNYLQETYRILKPGGLAVLYFGRYYKFSHNKPSRLFYHLDTIIERFILKNGYVELPARVNSTNLRISLSYAIKKSESIGFKVLRKLVSRKNVPDGTKLYGGQNGLVLMKL